MAPLFHNITQAIYTLEPQLYGNLLSQIRGSTTSWYHFDGLGSVDRLSNASGTVTDNYIYQAFGSILLSSGSTVNPFRYVGGLGYYYDPDLPQYFLRARYYDPTSGRFRSKDPIGFGGEDANLYRLVHNNPVNGTDPKGLQGGLLGGGKQQCIFAVYNGSDEGEGTRGLKGGKIAGGRQFMCEAVNRAGIANAIDMKNPGFADLIAVAKSRGCCISTLFVVTDGYAGDEGAIKLGNRKLNSKDVEELGKVMCRGSTIHLLSCYAGVGGGKSAAGLILQSCSKVAIVTGCKSCYDFPPTDSDVNNPADCLSPERPNGGKQILPAKGCKDGRSAVGYSCVCQVRQPIVLPVGPNPKIVE